MGLSIDFTQRVGLKGFAGVNGLVHGEIKVVYEFEQILPATGLGFEARASVIDMGVMHKLPDPSL
jgi:hypothetical protein